MRIFTLLALGLLAPLGAQAQGVKQPAPAPVLQPPASHSDPNQTMGPGASVTSHRATLQVTVVGDGDQSLQGWVQAGGQKAYGLVVPPGGRVSVRLHHAKEGYFHVARKVLHNLGYVPDKCLSGDPMNCFNNATDHAIDVYFVVSDPEHWADEKSPYTVEFTRSWKPGADTGGVKVQQRLSL